MQGAQLKRYCECECVVRRKEETVNFAYTSKPLLPEGYRDIESKTADKYSHQFHEFFRLSPFFMHGFISFQLLPNLLLLFLFTGSFILEVFACLHKPYHRASTSSTSNTTHTRSSTVQVNKDFARIRQSFIKHL